MADEKITDLTAVTTLADTDLVLVVYDVAGTPVTRKMTKANFVTLVSSSLTRVFSGIITNPNGYYTITGAVVPLLQAPAALTITKIVVKSDDSTPGGEIAGDLKFADDEFAGSLANATVIDVCDTTNGSFEATSSFSDATVPANKYIYFQFDSAPHTDNKRMFIQFHYTYD